MMPSKYFSSPSPRPWPPVSTNLRTAAGLVSIALVGATASIRISVIRCERALSTSLRHLLSTRPLTASPHAREPLNNPLCIPLALHVRAENHLSPPFVAPADLP